MFHTQEHRVRGGPIKITEGTRSGSCSISSHTTESACIGASGTWTSPRSGALAIDNQGSSVTFRIGAVGNLGVIGNPDFTDDYDDQWTLDQNKKLENTVSGL